MNLSKLGLDVKVLCLAESPIHEYLSRFPEVKTLPLNYRPRNYFDLKLRTELLQLTSDEVNLVHVHQPSLLGSVVPWLIGKKRNKIALIATRHIMNDHNKKDFIHRAIYRRLDYLIVMSHTLRKNVLQTHPVRERDVKVVNLGLDFNLFDPTRVDANRQRELWGVDSETIVIGLVGRIDPGKGQATFIKAAAGLLNRMQGGEKLKFVIVGEETLGSSENYLEELKQMLNIFRLTEHVVFAGYQENIPEIMKAFDIFVMPSRQEAFGLVAIEAMAMECPVILSSGGSAEEIVGREEYGLMVRPNDAFDLQLQIRYLLDHPAERVRMGKKGRLHVMSNYDKQKRIVKTLSLYDRALKRRGNR